MCVRARQSLRNLDLSIQWCHASSRNASPIPIESGAICVEQVANGIRFSTFNDMRSEKWPTFQYQRSGGGLVWQTLISRGKKIINCYLCPLHVYDLATMFHACTMNSFSTTWVRLKPDETIQLFAPCSYADRHYYFFYAFNGNKSAIKLCHRAPHNHVFHLKTFTVFVPFFFSHFYVQTAN